MDQVKSLLKPVKDEEDRMKMIVGDLQQSNAIKHTPSENIDLNISVDTSRDSVEAQQDNAEVNNILRDLDKENSKKKLEILQAREQMKIKIAKCNDDDAEKKRLMDQLNAFEANLTDQMRQETEGQNAKLLKALEDRRNRRKKKNDKAADLKQQKILDDFRNGANSKVNM